MRRWNGWGDDAIHLPLPQSALTFLRERVGEPTRPADVSFDFIVRNVAASRLPDDPRIDATARTRLLHARGQSLPDWLALRFGNIDCVPDGVAFPQSSQDVRDLLAFAKAHHVDVIPYGGGTSVVGHINPLPSQTPVLTISLAHMRQLIDLDAQSGLATFAAGVNGPDLEAQLRARGYTLGHFPQSFEYATLGGWIVTRSSGQQSLRYGRIEQLFAGGQIETPSGSMRIPTFPASSAGIDIRGLVLGSEGRLGIVTEATVRVRTLPKHESFHGWFFPNWKQAQAGVHELVNAGLPLSMMRLANPLETLTTLRLAGGNLVRLLEGYLALRGSRNEKCLLLVGITGDEDPCAAALVRAKAILSKHAGIYSGTRLGKRWEHNRFRGVYLRNSLWEAGYAVDTVETAVDWPRVASMAQAIESTARNALGEERVHAYTHLSHVYTQGSSVYSTFIFRIAPDYETNMQRWRALKTAVSQTIVAEGGTISHQHGVGVDHKPYLAAEKGALGIEAMRALFAQFDPDGMMNPGKLV